jgi:hypothetical protein
VSFFVRLLHHFFVISAMTVAGPMLERKDDKERIGWHNRNGKRRGPIIKRTGSLAGVGRADTLRADSNS